MPLGGGGLSAGIAIAMKSEWPQTLVVGCSPANAAVMIRSVEAGRVVEPPSGPTLSDGTAGGLEAGTITLPLCRDWIDEFVTVSEHEIALALRLVVQKEAMLIEGAAAVAVAGYRRLAARFTERPVVVVLSGANIAAETLARVLADR